MNIEEFIFSCDILSVLEDESLSLEEKFEIINDLDAPLDVLEKTLKDNSLYDDYQLWVYLNLK